LRKDFDDTARRGFRGENSREQTAKHQKENQPAHV
jgi:hypothetical protein